VIIESPKTEIPADVQSASLKATVGLTAADAILMADPELVLGDQDALEEIELDVAEKIEVPEEQTEVHQISEVARPQVTKEETALIITTPTPVEASPIVVPAQESQSLQTTKSTATADGCDVIEQGMETKEVFLLMREKTGDLIADGFLHALELRARKAVASFGTVTEQRHVSDVDDLFATQVTRHQVCVDHSYWFPGMLSTPEAVVTNRIRTAGFNSYRRGLVYYTKLQEVLRSPALQRRSAIRGDRTLSETFIDAVAGELQSLMAKDCVYDLRTFNNTVVAGWNAFVIRSIERMEAVGTTKVEVPLFRNAVLSPPGGNGLGYVGWAHSYARLRKNSLITASLKFLLDRSSSTQTERSNFQFQPIPARRMAFIEHNLVPLSPIPV